MADPSAQYWLYLNDEPAGPFPFTAVQAMLRDGRLIWDDLIFPVGHTKWQPIRNLPEFFSATSSPTFQPPAAPLQAIQAGPPAFHGQPSLNLAPAISTRSQAKAIWDPMGIYWLGFLFTPIWSGVMGAINEFRLDRQNRIWLPVAGGIGAMLLVLISQLIFHAYWLNLLVYCLATMFISVWGFVDSQEKTIKERSLSTAPARQWLVPTLAGAPLGLIVLLYILITPFLPLSHMEVAERFAVAKTAAEARRYSTERLFPAMDTLYNLAIEDNPEDRYQLYDEGRHGNGNMVGILLVLKSAKGFDFVDGKLILVRTLQGWKVDEFYVTALNDVPINPWLAVSAEYPLLVANFSEIAPVNAPPARTSQSKSTHEKSFWQADARKWGIVIFLVAAAICRSWGRTT